MIDMSLVTGTIQPISAWLETNMCLVVKENGTPLFENWLNRQNQSSEAALTWFKENFEDYQVEVGTDNITLAKVLFCLTVVCISIPTRLKRLETKKLSLLTKFPFQISPIFERYMKDECETEDRLHVPLTEVKARIAIPQGLEICFFDMDDFHYTEIS